MRVSLLILFICLQQGFFCKEAKALVELTTTFYYRQQYGGANQEISSLDRIYTASLAVYLFSLTGIELSLSQERKEVISHTVTPISGTTFRINKMEQYQTNYIASAGIRQLLLPREFSFRPSLSAGYAQKTVRSYSNYYLEETLTLQNLFIAGEVKEIIIPSSFLSLLLQWKLTAGISLSGVVKSIVPGLEWDKWKNDLTYQVGLSFGF